jgi:uncharacterized membrane protein YgcG
MRRIVWLILLWLVLAGCRTKTATYDPNKEVPKGDPAFPALTTSWIIDKAKVLSPATVGEGNNVCQGLQDDGIAEVVVVVISGVKHPEQWATHYGRWLGLGRKGMSTEGGNNGVVWLIRPDAELKMTISVGRGLPRFTVSDYGRIMDAAKDYLNFGNFDEGVLKIVRGTDHRLRELYGRPGRTRGGKGR